MRVGHHLFHRVDLGCEDFCAISEVYVEEAELAFCDKMTSSHSGERTTYGSVLLLRTIRVLDARRPKTKFPNPL